MVDTGLNTLAAGSRDAAAERRSKGGNLGKQHVDGGSTKPTFRGPNTLSIGPLLACLFSFSDIVLL